MTATDLTLEALDFIDAGADATASATIANAKASQLRRIARDLTAAMQEIYALAPELYKRRDGHRIEGPQSITVTVTEGGISLNTASTIIDGSTISIGSDETFNIVRVDGATKTLTIPFKGLGGTYPAKVWNDSNPLAASVDRVLGAASLNEQFPLHPRANRDDALTSRIREPDYGRRISSVSTRRMEGQPDSFWVEAVFKSDGTPLSHQSRLRFHVYPLPKTVYNVAYDVRLKAPQFSVADLGNDGAASSVPLVVAADMQEAVVRPLFLERWSGSPWFRNKEALKQIEKDVKTARGLLEQYRVQQPRRIRRVPGL